LRIRSGRDCETREAALAIPGQTLAELRRINADARTHRREKKGEMLDSLGRLSGRAKRERKIAYQKPLSIFIALVSLSSVLIYERLFRPRYIFISLSLLFLSPPLNSSSSRVSRNANAALLHGRYYNKASSPMSAARS
jgi:hypothetical protein